MGKVSLKFYYVFCIVANCKDYKEASKKLNISEVTIKKKIKYLEDYFDTKLILSNKKEIELTTIGKELYKDIQKPMEGIEAAIVSVLSKKKKVLEKDYAKIYNIYKYL